MSLLPGEQRTLSEIDSRLTRSDPRLTAMFAAFATRAAAVRPDSQDPLRTWAAPGPRAQLIVLYTVAITLLLASVCVSLLAAFLLPSRRGYGGDNRVSDRPRRRWPFPEPESS